MMALTDTSELLLSGMLAALDAWAARMDGTDDPLYWRLRLNLAETGLGTGESVDHVIADIPDAIREDVLANNAACAEYWHDVRYASLHPVTQLWGTIVNSLRVAADSDRATEGQKRVFQFEAESLVSFFRAARERMEVADGLYHSFKAMPAPECQALAALLNVHVDVPLDAVTLCRLVRLLDHEGRMTELELEDLASLSNTHLVDAAFRGLRGNA